MDTARMCFAGQTRRQKCLGHGPCTTQPRQPHSGSQEGTKLHNHNHQQLIRLQEHPVCQSPTAYAIATPNAVLFGILSFPSDPDDVTATPSTHPVHQEMREPLAHLPSASTSADARTPPHMKAVGGSVLHEHGMPAGAWQTKHGGDSAGGTKTSSPYTTPVPSQSRHVLSRTMKSDAPPCSVARGTSLAGLLSQATLPCPPQPVHDDGSPFFVELGNFRGALPLLPPDAALIPCEPDIGGPPGGSEQLGLWTFQSLFWHSTEHCSRRGGR